MNMTNLEQANKRLANKIAIAVVIFWTTVPALLAFLPPIRAFGATIYIMGLSWRDHPGLTVLFCLEYTALGIAVTSLFRHFVLRNPHVLLGDLWDCGRCGARVVGYDYPVQCPSCGASREVSA